MKTKGNFIMADYYGKTRTNYFSVTDEEKFKQIINSCGAENGGIIIADQKQNNGTTNDLLPLLA